MVAKELPRVIVGVRREPAWTTSTALCCRGGTAEALCARRGACLVGHADLAARTVGALVAGGDGAGGSRVHHSGVHRRDGGPTSWRRS